MTKDTITINIDIGWTLRRNARTKMDKIQKAYIGDFWYSESWGLFKSTFTLTCTDNYVGQSALQAAIMVS